MSMKSEIYKIIDYLTNSQYWIMDWDTGNYDDWDCALEDVEDIIYSENPDLIEPYLGDTPLCDLDFDTLENILDQLSAESIIEIMSAINRYRPSDEDMDDYVNSLNEDIDPLKDKYSPRVDITDKSRYDYYRYKGRDFAYDKKDALVLYLYKDEEEGDDAPFRELDAVGLSREHWKNRESRNEYLNEYIYDLEAEAEQLVDDFMKYEYRK